MSIAADIRPGDDPVEVFKKLVGRTRTKYMEELFGYFDIPAAFISHVFGNLHARDTLTQREREHCAVAALCVLNRANELKSHIIAAVRAGATKEGMWPRSSSRCPLTAACRSVSKASRSQRRYLRRPPPPRRPWTDSFFSPPNI